MNVTAIAIMAITHRCLAIHNTAVKPESTDAAILDEMAAKMSALGSIRKLLIKGPAQQEIHQVWQSRSDRVSVTRCLLGIKHIIKAKN